MTIDDIRNAVKVVAEDYPISRAVLVYAVARTAPARTSNRTLPHFEPHFDGR